jgi:hypothetical protein
MIQMLIQKTITINKGLSRAVLLQCHQILSKIRTSIANARLNRLKRYQKFYGSVSKGLVIRFHLAYCPSLQVGYSGL